MDIQTGGIGGLESTVNILEIFLYSVIKIIKI